MIRALFGGALVLGLALPAAAQDYYTTTTQAKHGNGYTPASIVAGWRRAEDFQVLSVAPEGARVGAGGLATQWKVTLVTDRNPMPEDEEFEDERYRNFEDGPLEDNGDAGEIEDEPTNVVITRQEAVYSSLTCPVIAARLEALRPLTGFEFNPASLDGNRDGRAGDGTQTFDLWIRAGQGELGKSAGAPDSALGQWFQQTLVALGACPVRPAP